MCSSFHWTKDVPDLTAAVERAGNVPGSFGLEKSGFQAESPGSIQYLFPTKRFPPQLRLLRILLANYSMNTLSGNTNVAESAFQIFCYCHLTEEGCDFYKDFGSSLLPSLSFCTPSSWVPYAVRPSMAPWEVGNSYWLLYLLIVLSYSLFGYSLLGHSFSWAIVLFFPCYPGGASSPPRMQWWSCDQAGLIRGLFEIHKRGMEGKSSLCMGLRLGIP